MLLAILPALWAAAFAQPEPIPLDVVVEPETAAVGEPITLTVTATHPAGIRWEPRSASDRHGPFDIEQVEGPVALPGAEGAGERPVSTRWVFRLVAFELGDLEIPPLELRYSDPSGEEVRSVATPARTVRIEAGVADPGEDPADIRWGFGLPPGSRLLLWLLGGSLAVAAVAAAWAWSRRKGRPGRPVAAPEPPRPAKPLRPAYDRYLEALEALLAERLLEAGRLKEFHIRIAEIVKRYLGEVFAFDAIDRTTMEVLLDLGAVAKPALRSETSAFLGQCDRVKFAKHLPDPGECGETIGRAREILEQGRPAAPAPAGVAEAAGEGS